MNLVVVITGTDVGGAQSMLQKVLMRCSPELKPHVISMCQIGTIGERIRALGVPVESLDMRPGVPNPIALIRLIGRLRQLKPDVVHSWMYHADFMGGIAARFAGVPAVAWCIRHSNFAPGINKRVTLAVIKANALLSHWVPDRILCNSEVARDVHVAYGFAPEKMVVIPNGFDVAHFKPDRSSRLAVRAELGLGSDTPLVGLIGRFDPQKNHLGFLQAAVRLHLKKPKVHFVLAGGKIDKGNKALMQACATAGLSSVIHLLGPRDDIPRLMASLDLLASSSIGEAFPNVLGEAMACGVPCVVTDVGDSAYIVGDTGRVVASGDMRGLADAMESVLSSSLDERTSLGERARARVMEKFEIGHVVRQYEAFYRSLADLGRRKRNSTARKTEI